MPADHGVRLNEAEMDAPGLPTAGDDRPEDAIFVAELRLRPPAGVDREPLAQDQILDQQITARAQRLTNEAKKQAHVHPHRRPSGRLASRAHTY